MISQQQAYHELIDEANHYWTLADACAPIDPDFALSCEDYAWWLWEQATEVKQRSEVDYIVWLIWWLDSVQPYLAGQAKTFTPVPVRTQEAWQ